MQNKLLFLIILALLLRTRVFRIILVGGIGIILLVFAGCAGMPSPVCPEVKVDIKFCPAAN